MSDKLYMCYVAGGDGARKTHRQVEDANKEAKRLSVLEHNQGKSVFVLESVSQYRDNEEVK